jgi:hypothetical protein
VHGSQRAGLAIGLQKCQRGAFEPTVSASLQDFLSNVIHDPWYSPRGILPARFVWEKKRVCGGMFLGFVPQMIPSYFFICNFLCPQVKKRHAKQHGEHP